MRIAALLSWYDERPDFLYNSVVTLAKAGVTDLVAVDGRYRHYPGQTTRSPASNYEALIRGADKADVRLLIDAPTEPWRAETDKRTRLFQLADTLDADWYLIHDGDHLIDQAPGDLHAKLTRTDKDVAEVVVHEPRRNGQTEMYRVPLLYRATPGITVTGNHFTYRAPDGRHLWGSGQLAERLRIDSMIVRHLSQLRDQQRQHDATEYYRKRDTLGLEHGPCHVCGQAGAHSLPTDWRKQQDGDLTAIWVSACDQHAARIREDSEQQIRALGHDPATVTVTNKKVMA